MGVCLSLCKVLVISYVYFYFGLDCSFPVSIILFAMLTIPALKIWDFRMFSGSFSAEYRF